MGMYSNAHLFYGFVVEVERDEETYERKPHPLRDEDEDSWFYDVADFLAASSDRPDPWDEIPTEIRSGYDDAAYKEWKASNTGWEGRKEAWYEWKRTLGNDAPVAFEHHGHCDSGEPNPLYIRIVGPGEYNADCWSAQEIDPDELAVDPGSVERAQAWCEEHGVPFGNPKWLLVASYG